MADLRGFDANRVEPSKSFEPLPAGDYLAVIVDSEWQTTKSGSGQYLKFTFQIVEGPHQHRQLFARLNLKNPNPVAVEIAQAELSALCRAVQVLQPQDSSELHQLPLLVQVRCVKRGDTGEIGNEIRGYRPRPAAAESFAGNGSALPPWSRG